MTRPIHLVLFVKLWLINDKNLYLSIWRNWRINFCAEISLITWNKYTRIWEKITVLFKFSLSAIKELFWNLRGVRRSCRPPPPPCIRPWVHPPNKNVLLLTYEYASLFGKFVNTYKYKHQVQYASLVHNNKWYIETWVQIALIINRKV